MFNSKKGLSPLIAAVLLIVVVVGIGAVVTGIVRNYVTENKQTITEKASDMKCGVEVSVNVPVVADEFRLCNDSVNSNITFTLENSGSATIDELQVKFFGGSGFDSQDEALALNGLSGGFDAGSTQEISVHYDTAKTGAPLQQVKIVPRVKVVGRSDKAYCTDAALTFTDLTDC
ncbi:hypothetical protein KY359_04750 [Candidatus Woesearchaeota archaeon]|nr:hypothetical protein [Candidatus Woesearchaeota archaeon]